MSNGYCNTEYYCPRLHYMYKSCINLYSYAVLLTENIIDKGIRF